MLNADWGRGFPGSEFTSLVYGLKIGGGWVTNVTVWYLVQGTWYLVQGTWYLVQGTWCRVLGAWCRVQCAGCSVQCAVCRVRGPPPEGAAKPNSFGAAGGGCACRASRTGQTKRLQPGVVSSAVGPSQAFAERDFSPARPPPTDSLALPTPKARIHRVPWTPARGLAWRPISLEASQVFGPPHLPATRPLGL